jgi:pilus assembly protein CpaB
MRSRWIVLAAALVLGLLAAIGAGQYVSAVRAQAQAGATPVAVLVARVDIPKGTSVDEITTKSMTEIRKIPQDYVSAGAISSLKIVDGRVLAVPLVKGEQISSTRFQFPSDAGLSFAVPSGMVALTVPADETHGVAGLVKPGDSLAVVCSIKEDPNNESSWRTHVLVNGAQVLAVGHSTGADAGGGEQQQASNGGAFGAASQAKPASSITLALLPKDLERVVFAEEVGRVWLGLLPTEQKALGATSGQVRQTLFK